MIAGVVEEVGSAGMRVRRVTAPNPSALTGAGTNSYILGEGRVAVIDPGPAMAAHFSALTGALAPHERVAAILVTHAHLDHSALALALARATGAPVHAAGRADEGRSAQMAKLAATGLAGGGEGLDLAFVPDIRLADGAALSGDGWHVAAVATPGHLPTHLCFDAGEVLFSGDHVMGWSTSIVSPPDGDMAAYMASLARLQSCGAARFLPGHGAAIGEPLARVAELAAHRRAREAAILAALGPRGRTAAEVAAAVYTDVPPTLLPAAERNVLAHLIDLEGRGLAVTDDAPGTAARYRPG
ncbi:MAG: MBL fold metallo-hydrolase [Rhodobacteraceae bacterium]|jgi:hydroxyacylglutathione hydrolase|nr:MBL fold metallo-hydrolase [Paracoccaceae bacterium]